RPPRYPQAVPVRFQPSERAFYEAVRGLYAALRPDLDGWGLAMAVLQVFRYTASCMPAAVALFREKARDSGLTFEGELDLSSEDEDGWRAPTSSEAGRERLRDLAGSLADIVDRL